MAIEGTQVVLLQPCLEQRLPISPSDHQEEIERRDPKDLTAPLRDKASEQPIGQSDNQ
jgi:hypothetical protein